MANQQTNEKLLRQINELQGESAEVGEVGVDEIDTSDWLTYRNEEYGFEFQYPEIEDIKIVKEKLSNNMIMSVTLPIKITERFYFWETKKPGSCEGEPCPIIKIGWSKDNKAKENFLNKVKFVLDEECIEYCIPMMIGLQERTREQALNEEIMITRKKGIEVFKFDPGGMGPNPTIVIIKNDLQIIMQTRYSEDVLNKIAESVKFVNKNSVNEIDTSGLLTYENEEYGFDVKYPPNPLLKKETNNHFAVSYINTYPPEGEIRIGITKNPDRLDINKFFGKGNEYFNLFEASSSYEEKFINNKRWIIFEDIIGMYENIYATTELKDDFLYLRADRSNDLLESIFWQMLENIEFND